ncbi:MAG TPA: hypothetical protein VJV75_06355, partial [Candidatus Polarisedimenticolia bacterium]|nr:hypothetical protein [Candidatus Polarisedimenticolia bacterium]
PGYEMPDPPRFAAPTPSPAPAPRATAAIEEETPEDLPAVTSAAALASGLSDETLDRLADLIVQRMSDRVVREIAWDVLPEVAEAVVRERIRALEDAGR